MIRLDWWTPFTFLFPHRYVDLDDFWREFDLEAWSATAYEWDEDDWNGLLDFASHPRETVQLAAGDCEDYALVAASWALANDRPGVGLAFCIEPNRPWPSHVIAFDDERVYSSGVITEQSVECFLERTKYDRTLRRRLD